MNSTMRFSALGLAGFLVVGASTVSLAQQAANMTFFVTSAGSGKGADLGGLAGADRICQQLAQAVGAGSHTWHAYLSTQAADGQAAVNARDRIGKGPWQNAKGVVVAKDVAELHGDNNNLNKQTALTEKGEMVNGRGDTPNTHDMLTGSNADGTLAKGTGDVTCGNWTSTATDPASLNKRAAALGPKFNIFESNGQIVPTAPAFLHFTPPPYLRPFNLGNPIP